MSDRAPPDLAAPFFFLIIADHDRNFFSVEGPRRTMSHCKLSSDAREQARQVTCGPSGTDRATLAVEFRGPERMAGVTPGSIVRLRE